MIMKRVLVVLLLAALPVIAQDAKPKKPNPFKSKKFWIETGITVGFALLDGVSTTRAMKACPTCTEGNPIFGSRRPSKKRRYLIGGAFIVGERLAIAAIWRNDEKAGTMLSTVATAGHVVFHSAFAAHNFALAKSQERLRVCPAQGDGCAVGVN
jgi:hypothetical protein